MATWTNQWFGFAGSQDESTEAVADAHCSNNYMDSGKSKKGTMSHFGKPETKKKKFTSLSVKPPPPALVDGESMKPASDLSASDKSAESLIADALSEMTIKDREHATFEVHGVAEDVDENPAFVSEKIQELRQALDKMKQHSFLVDTKAFQLAEAQDPDFVYDIDFCLDFLRTDMYRAKEAARRMIRYYNWKMKLFGESKLCKRITYDDLTEEELEVVKEGFFQRLPQRDRAGRLVVVLFPAMVKYATYNSLARILFMFDAGERDLESQKKGGIPIIYDHSDGTTNFGAEPWWLSKAMLEFKTCCPQKMAAAHYCYANQSALRRAGLQFMLSFIDREERARIKIHSGTHSEIMYSLMTYGIPHHLIPISADGRLDNKHILQMIEMKQNLADFVKGSGVDKNLKMTTLPSNTDILLGRGRPIQEHPGNVRLHTIVDELLPRYDKMSKTEKTELANKVVQSLKPGCFLSQECGVWTEVSDDVAREKVSHLFRGRRRAMVQRQKKKQQQREQQEAQVVVVNTTDDAIENPSSSKLGDKSKQKPEKKATSGKRARQRSNA